MLFQEMLDTLRKNGGDATFLVEGKRDKPRAGGRVRYSHISATAEVLIPFSFQNVNDTVLVSGSVKNEYEMELQGVEILATMTTSLRKRAFFVAIAGAEDEIRARMVTLRPTLSNKKKVAKPRAAVRAALS